MSTRTKFAVLPSLRLDLQQRAIGANVTIDLLEEFILASPKEAYSREHLFELCKILRQHVAKWAE